MNPGLTGISIENFPRIFATYGREGSNLQWFIILDGNVNSS